MSDLDRFMRFVLPDTSGCWLWQGALIGGGYGAFQIAGQVRRAHRWLYLLVIGPIPGDLPLDHLCRVRRCVNPTHLEPVTMRVNVVDRAPTSVSGINARKATCPQGHPYSGLNSRGRRICRACAREWMRTHRASQKAAA